MKHKSPSMEDMMKNVKVVSHFIAICLCASFGFASYADAESGLYFIHTDHLGTPQKLTDINQSIVWEVESQTPFGEVEIKEDPDGDGEGVTFNLRFPGQYYDKETETHYNYYRTYDPSLGRYLQSDPLGLYDGPNTYAYVHGNPINYYDPTGEAALHPARGAFWVGGRVGSGINWGIRWASGGRSLGTLIYDWTHDDDWTSPLDDDGPDPLDPDYCPTSSVSGGGSGGGGGDRCRQVKNNCIAMCSIFGLPSRFGDGVSFQRCVNNCMSREGC